ncbi:MAG: hypothetical protein JST22_07405 [Bacteroidetes bacterium]|nr:hypothetical protein [Bacteroidota bacterium]
MLPHGGSCNLRRNAYGPIHFDGATEEQLSDVRSPPGPGIVDIAATADGGLVAAWHGW